MVNRLWSYREVRLVKQVEEEPKEMASYRTFSPSSSVFISMPLNSLKGIRVEVNQQLYPFPPGNGQMLAYLASYPGLAWPGYEAMAYSASNWLGVRMSATGTSRSLYNGSRSLGTYCSKA